MIVSSTSSTTSSSEVGGDGPQPVDTLCLTTASCSLATFPFTLAGFVASFATLLAGFFFVDSTAIAAMIMRGRRGKKTND